MDENQENTPGGEEESIFAEDDFRIESHFKQVRDARAALFVVAGLQVVYTLIMSLTGQVSLSVSVVAISVLMAGIFAGLAIGARKKPVGAFACALILYILSDLLYFTLARYPWYRELFFDGAVIIFLIRGLWGARHVEEWMEKFGKHGS